LDVRLVPRCLDAARALQPLWSQPAEKVITFATSLGHTEGKFTELLESIELSTPEIKEGVGQVTAMEFGSATAVSNMCGVTLVNTPIGRVVAGVMGAKQESSSPSTRR
jgi:hypothetical protein